KIYSKNDSLNGNTVNFDFIKVNSGITLSGWGTIIANVLENDGSITAQANHTLTIEISGSITGTGTLGITNQTTMILDGPVGSGQTIQFQISSGAIGTLVLNHPNEFSGTIQGFSNITRIDLPNIKFSPTVSATVVKYDQVANITTVAITDGNNTDTLKLVGDYRPPAHTFNFSSDGPNNGTIVVDPPASTTNALTTTTDTSTTTTDASIATDAATTITDATVTPVAQASTLTATK